MEKKDREYSNEDITVYWKPAKCIHATTCYRELIQVFNPRKRPWVDMSGAPTDEIIRIVDLCPTDALTYSWNDKDKQEEIKRKEGEREQKLKENAATGAQIRVMLNGPLVVRGEFTIVGTDGEEMKKVKMTSFCRCGQSQSMPFCDGMHRKIGFSG